jgi:hypothetical protein
MESLSLDLPLWECYDCKNRIYQWGETRVLKCYECGSMNISVKPKSESKETSSASNGLKLWICRDCNLYQWNKTPITKCRLCESPNVSLKPQKKRLLSSSSSTSSSLSSSSKYHDTYPPIPSSSSSLSSSSTIEHGDGYLHLPSSPMSHSFYCEKCGETLTSERICLVCEFDAIWQCPLCTTCNRNTKLNCSTCNHRREIQTTAKTTIKKKYFTWKCEIDGCNKDDNNDTFDNFAICGGCKRNRYVLLCPNEYCRLKNPIENDHSMVDYESQCDSPYTPYCLQCGKKLDIKTNRIVNRLDRDVKQEINLLKFEKNRAIEEEEKAVLARIEDEKYAKRVYQLEFFKACRVGDEEAIMRWSSSKYGVSLAEKDNDGRTALHLVYLSDNVKAIKLVSQMSVVCSIQDKDLYGRTPKGYDSGLFAGWCKKQNGEEEERVNLWKGVISNHPTMTIFKEKTNFISCNLLDVSDRILSFLQWEIKKE